MSDNSLIVQESREIEHTAASPLFNAAVRVRLLNTELNAVYEHGTNGSDTFTRILVMPADDVGGYMTLAEIAKAINDMINSITGVTGTFDAGNLKPVLGQFGLGGLTSIKICLRQVFFYSDSSTKNKETKSSLEYAICIEIDEPLVPSSPELKKLFSIEKLSFAVWNTNRKKIMDRMQLGSIDSLLG